MLRENAGSPGSMFCNIVVLYRQETWQQVVATQDEEQRLARLEEYSSYVDTVESQILREIAALQAHSTQFFEASTLLQVGTATLPPLSSLWTRDAP